MRAFQDIKKGFTIVELLVVITVIGILASIGLVSYSSTQNRAKKESFNATAQQVKLKLGEHYTDKNVYPADGQKVLDYLDANGSRSLADTIRASGQYDYQARTSTNGGCTEALRNCQTYTITVLASNWRGAVPGDNIIVKP